MCFVGYDFKCCVILFYDMLECLVEYWFVVVDNIDDCDLFGIDLVCYYDDEFVIV